MPASSDTNAWTLKRGSPGTAQIPRATRQTTSAASRRLSACVVVGTEAPRIAAISAVVKTGRPMSCVDRRVGRGLVPRRSSRCDSERLGGGRAPALQTHECKPQPMRGDGSHTPGTGQRCFTLRSTDA